MDRELLRFVERRGKEEGREGKEEMGWWCGEGRDGGEEMEVQYT